MKNMRNPLPTALSLAMTAAVALSACVPPPAPSSYQAIQASPAAQAQVLTNQTLPTLAPMLEQATPAVVNIATEGTVTLRPNPLFNDPFFRRFFDLPKQPRERRTQSSGSGVVVDAAKGYIITNHHVIEAADNITVTLNDGRQFDADIIGSDPGADVAVIQISANNLAALPMANSDTLRVGDFVVAIGNPFGLGQTVTSGIVSALGRSGLGQGYEDFIQTDASINPGNSGGALVNLRGELVGINTAILAPGGGNVGINFAIPANMVANLMDQLVKYGQVRRGQLGVLVQDLSPELAESFGLRRRQGAVVAQIIPGSAAARAGLKEGDVVVAVDDRPIRSSGALRNAIGLLQVGQSVKLDLLRDGKPLTITVTLREPSPTTANRVHQLPRQGGLV